MQSKTGLFLESIGYFFLTLAFLSFFALTVTGCREGRNGGITRTEVNSGESETGVTQSQDVPFSAETIEDIKGRESDRLPPEPEQRVIPFQEAPPPVELPEPETLLPVTIPAEPGTA